MQDSLPVNSGWEREFWDWRTPKFLFFPAFWPIKLVCGERISGIIC